MPYASAENPRARRAARAATALVGGAALLVMLFAIPHAGAAFKYLKTGMEVPDFSLKELGGAEHSLAEVKGQPATLIVFWATWSPRSEPALADAEKLYEEYGEKGLRVLAVNVNRVSLGPQDRSEIEAMREKLGLKIPIVVDAGLEAYSTFGVVATPSLAVLDAEGKIVHEAASYLARTGDGVRESVEILLGVREAPAADAVAAAPAYKPDTIALRHYNFGRTMFQRGNRDKAMDQLEKAAEADPKYAAPRVFLGQLLLARHREKDMARAEELFAEAVELAPEDVAALTGHGEALLETGKTEEAVAVFQKAVAADPTYTPAVSSLALALAKQGKAAEAEAQFKAALELNPVDPGTYRRRGESFEATGDLKGAAADYRRTIEILMNLPRTGDEV